MLLTPSVRLLLVSEYGIEDSSKLSTSFSQTGCNEEPDKQVLVGVNSNELFAGFDFELLIYASSFLFTLRASYLRFELLIYASSFLFTLYDPLDLDVWNREP